MAEAIHKLFRRLLGKVGIEERKGRPGDAVRPNSSAPLGRVSKEPSVAPRKKRQGEFERVSDRHEVRVALQPRIDEPKPDDRDERRQTRRAPRKRRLRRPRCLADSRRPRCFRRSSTPSGGLIHRRLISDRLRRARRQDEVAPTLSIALTQGLHAHGVGFREGFRKVGSVRLEHRERGDHLTEPCDRLEAVFLKRLITGPRPRRQHQVGARRKHRIAVVTKDLDPPGTASDEVVFADIHKGCTCVIKGSKNASPPARG